MRRLALAACALAIAVMAGCSAVPLGDPFGSWRLAAFGDEPVPADAAITLTLVDGSATGSAGCNRFSGPYRSDGPAQLRISDLATPRMACEPPILQREQRFLDALGRIQMFVIAGGRLVLTDRAGGAPLILEPA